MAWQARKPLSCLDLGVARPFRAGAAEPPLLDQLFKANRAAAPGVPAPPLPAAAAGPPSPLKPQLLTPARVTMVPVAFTTSRMRWLSQSEMKTLPLRPARPLGPQHRSGTVAAAFLFV
jgi:hypothetical protein